MGMAHVRTLDKALTKALILKTVEVAMLLKLRRERKV